MAKGKSHISRILAFSDIYRELVSKIRVAYTLFAPCLPHEYRKYDASTLLPAPFTMYRIVHNSVLVLCIERICCLTLVFRNSFPY